MDIRREWTADEELLKKFSDRRGFPLAVVLTKADKLSRGQMFASCGKSKKDFGSECCVPGVLFEKEGQDEVEDYIYENWVKA